MSHNRRHMAMELREIACYSEMTSPLKLFCSKFDFVSNPMIAYYIKQKWNLLKGS
jgi:hypothetical protein